MRERKASGFGIFSIRNSGAFSRKIPAAMRFDGWVVLMLIGVAAVTSECWLANKNL